MHRQRSPFSKLRKSIRRTAASSKPVPPSALGNSCAKAAQVRPLNFSHHPLKVAFKNCAHCDRRCVLHNAIGAANKEGSCFANVMDFHLRW